MKTLYYLLITCLLFGCKLDQKKQEIETSESIINAEAPKDNSIEFFTESMEFFGPDSITSGWNTFKYINKSYETHFFTFEKLPDGKTLKDSKKEVVPVFQEGMDLLNSNNTEEGYATFNKLPAWFFEVVFTGGVGLVSPGKVASTTQYLEPGRYVIECYVKMSNGQFHSYHGMIKEIIVTEIKSKEIEPISNFNIDISSANGLKLDKTEAKAGNYIIAVNFIDQKLHEHFLGHDVHLVKLEAKSNLDTLNDWMNWSNPKGFISPAPEHIIFMGGIQEMPAGSKGYIKAKLDKGTYAFISEVPDPKGKNMLKVFEVID